MAGDAVGRDVQHAVMEPTDADITGIADAAPRAGTIGLDPVDTFAVLAPEFGRVVDRSVVHRLVLGFIDIGALGPIRADGDHLIAHGFLPNALTAVLLPF